MILTYSRATLLALRPVQTAINEPCRSVFRTRRGTRAGRRIIRAIPCVMRRKYNNKEADGDKRHHRRPQYLIPLANCNLSDICRQQYQYDNTVSIITTIVTRRFEQPKHTRNSVVCYENLQTIKPVKDCLKTAKRLTLSSLNCRSVKK